MQLNIEKIVYDVNSTERKNLIIFDKNVGTYNFGIFSKWYLSRVQKTKTTIPNIGKYVCGLLCKEYQIDIKNLDILEIVEEKIKENYQDIGEWFEEKVLKEND